MSKSSSALTAQKFQPSFTVDPHAPSGKFFDALIAETKIMEYIRLRQRAYYLYFIDHFRKFEVDVRFLPGYGLGHPRLRRIEQLIPRDVVYAMRHWIISFFTGQGDELAVKSANAMLALDTALFIYAHMFGWETGNNPPLQLAGAVPGTPPKSPPSLLGVKFKREFTEKTKGLVVQITVPVGARVSMERGWGHSGLSTVADGDQTFLFEIERCFLSYSFGVNDLVIEGDRLEYDLMNFAIPGALVNHPYCYRQCASNYIRGLIPTHWLSGVRGATSILPLPCVQP